MTVIAAGGRQSDSAPHPTAPTIRSSPTLPRLKRPESICGNAAYRYTDCSPDPHSRSTTGRTGRAAPTRRGVVAVQQLGEALGADRGLPRDAGEDQRHVADRGIELSKYGSLSLNRSEYQSKAGCAGRSRYSYESSWIRTGRRWTRRVRRSAPASRASGLPCRHTRPR